MKILKLIKLFSYLFILSIMVISCSKETITTEETVKGEIDLTEETEQNSLLTRSISSENGLDLDCFTILFPFDVVDNEGETYTITSEDDFIEIFDESSETYVVDFVYPIDIEDEDGNTSSIADAGELGEAFANCLPNEWDENAFPAYLINLENSCLVLQYPVTVSKLDGSTTTYDDESSFVAALAEEPLFFVFPLSLLNNGVEIVATDVDELLTALFDCNGLDIDTTIWDGDIGFEYLGCYEIVFPFSLELIDETIVEVNDHMEYCDLLLEGNIQGFAFPMTLIDANGEEVIVNSQEELDELLEECWDWEGPVNFADALILMGGATGSDTLGVEACYTISFPISIEEVDFDGVITEIHTINSLDDLVTLLTGFSVPFIYNVVYPVTITLNETSVEVILQQSEDLTAILEDCQ